ncbi:Cof-type HAD-IIB family hydrolase [Niallia sp. FSL W8-0635]|uniref:Cof-type HAD-IIB family hydrolase n=1 Tax=Niallia sp. FSL W8-0635 TaxID=2975337 RepID=UPI0009D5C20C|nr:Putative hydrolase [Mycobacteroides abscessus subsp. abscessus]HEO8419199.1 HAD family phosphatase [Yersinia enterocolitica]
MTKNLEEKDIKLIALDMDGTLLNENGEIPEENRKAIKEAHDKGLHVVLSTGRSLATCKDHAKSLLLNSYLVTANGSEIWDTKGNLVERNLVDANHIQWMWGLAQQHKAKMWATSCDQLWFDEMPENVSELEWLKFGFHIEDNQIREKVLKSLQEKNCFEISNSSPVNIEVNALGINKARGLKKVCELLHISMDQVLAAGDSLNDISMIKEAGIGVAMGNAQDVVKETADVVTLTNNENGVAYAIRKWALKKEVAEIKK